jgi:hypothetical protein
MPPVKKKKHAMLNPIIRFYKRLHSRSVAESRRLVGELGHIDMGVTGNAAVDAIAPGILELIRELQDDECKNDAEARRPREDARRG